MKRLFLLFLVLGISCALYEHQAGVLDWSIKNIGEIKSVFFWESNIYFILKDQENMIGSLFAQSGNIEYLKEVSGKILNTKLEKEIHFFNENQNFVGVFQLKTGLVIKSIPVDIQNPIIGFATLEKPDFVIASKNQVIAFLDQKKAILYEASFGSSEQEEIVKIATDRSKKLMILLTKKDKLVLRRYELGLHFEKASEIISLNMRFNIEKLQISENAIIYEDIDKTKIYSLDSQELILVEKSPHTCFFTNSALGITETDEMIKLKEISFASKQLIGKIDYPKEKRKYCVRVPDFPVRGAKKAVVIATIKKQELKVDVFNLVEKENHSFETITKTLKSKVDQIRSFWVGEDGNMLLQTSDLQTIYFSGREQSALWAREDSLAYITKDHFVNFEDLEIKKVNDYFESLETQGTHNPTLILHNFGQRIKTEIEDWTALVQNTVTTAINQFKELTQSKTLKQALKILNKFEDNTGYEILYNLKKIILVITKFNTVFALDSKTGTIIWKQFLNFVIEDMSNYEVMDIFSLESKHEDIISSKVILVLFSKSSQKLVILNLSPATGEIVDQETIPIKSVFKILRIPAYRNIHNDALLIVDENFSLHFYPASISHNYKEKANKISIYALDEKSKLITGYKSDGERIKPTWNLHLNPKEEILQFKSPSSDDKNSLFHALSGEFIGIHEDKKIIFKHINYNNFAILTKQTIENDGVQTSVLNLYIINGGTGRILFNQYVSDVSFEDPINLIVDENAIFVTYFNTKNLVYEIWAVEAYLNKMENSFTNMLEKYYFNGHYSTLDSFNYNLNDLDIVFMHAKYAFLLGIKHASTFKSKKEITRKNLLIITSTNQVYSLDRALVSTRRSMRSNLQNLDLSTSLESIELPPYQYILPINDMHYLSYNLQLSNLKQIHSSPTNLESTSLLLAYGRDIFSCKVSPDNAYDRLNDDFNYFYLVGTVLTAVVATLFVKHLAQSTKIFQNFNR